MGPLELPANIFIAPIIRIPPGGRRVVARQTSTSQSLDEAPRLYEPRAEKAGS
jgi:hypothetical protein